MKYFLLHIALINGLLLSAQKADLIKYSSKLNDVLHTQTGLHLHYKLVVVGVEANSADSMHIDYFKKSDNEFKMVMGNMQTLARIGKMMLKINTIDKVISMEEDTSAVIEEYSLLENLSAIIDSATTITVIKKKGELIYTLSFSPTYMYQVFKLNFNSKTELPNSIYAKYSTQTGQEYSSIAMYYDVWDLNWKDKEDELQLNRFVEFKNNKYVVAAAYSDYKLFIPEHGSLNIDLK